MGHEQDVLDVVAIKSRRVARDASYPMDGGMINLWRLLEALADVDLTTRVMTRVPLPGEPSGPSVELAFDVDEVLVEPFPSDDTFVRDLHEAKAFGQALVRHRVPAGRVVHTHHWSSTAYLDEWLPSGVRHVHTPHLLAVDKAAIFGRSVLAEVRAIEAAALGRADAVIALSNAERASIVAAYDVPEARIHVIPNGVSYLHAKRPARTPGPTRLVSVGRLAHQKGFDRCVKAAALVARGHGPVHLTLMGGPYDEPDFEARLQESARAVLSDQLTIDIAGAVDHSSALDAMARADVVLQLGRFESQGIAILEAMASGTPTVAAEAPAVAEYVEDGVNGLLVPQTGTAEAAAAATERLLSDPDLAASVGQVGQVAARRFSWSAMQAATLAQLRDVD